MESTQSLPRQTSQSTLCVHVDPKNEPVSTATPLLDLDDATLVPQGWPTSPSRIKQSLSDKLLNGAFDIALFVFSSCFLVFSLVVMHYDQAQISENSMATNVLARAAKYGPTIFPLLFASVVGRATHAILLWRLEKGERIKILDMLATSTSLTSTVTSQIQLRQISVLSVLLVAIWALSPIGGQASLRQMSIETVLERSDASFQYVAPKYYDVVERFPAFPADEFFVAAMFASPITEASPVDLWGNIKIPKIEHYESMIQPDSDGWFENTSGDDDLATFSAFVGIPIKGTQDKTTITDYDFHLQTAYLRLECGYFDYMIRLPSDTLNVTGTRAFFWWNNTASRSTQALETLEPFNFIYHGAGYPAEISCSLTKSYAEIEVLCAVNSTCRAVKVRRSQLPQLPPAFTFMDLVNGTNGFVFMQNFMSTIGGDELSPFPSFLDMYLTDPSLKQGDSMFEYGQRRIPAEIWSERLSQLLNSYWICSSNYYTITGRIDPNTSFTWDENITFKPPKVDLGGPNSSYNYNWTGGGTYKSKVWTSQGNKYEHVEVMVSHKPWAITLAIASLVLIAFSIIPPLVRHFLTNGPDIAMNFSSLATRNNSHIPIPAGGSFLPAADRFRLLKDVRLRFADAEGKSDVGNLVITSEGVEKAELAGARKERLYE